MLTRAANLRDLENLRHAAVLKERGAPLLMLSPRPGYRKVEIDSFTQMCSFSGAARTHATHWVSNNRNTLPHSTGG